MSGLPIPDDWHNGDWDSYCIKWPSSPQWKAILVGFLTQATRGRFWDGDTGAIVDAQYIGRLIFDANFPLAGCCSCSSDTGNDQEIEGFDSRIADLIGGVFDMDCSIPYGSLKFINGVLHYRYCGEWYAVDGAPANTPSSEGAYSLPTDTDYDNQTISTCGMAAAVASLVVDLAGYIWDESDNTLPIFMIKQAQDHVGLDLNNTWLLDAVNQALIMKGAVVISGTVIDLERSDVIPSWLQDELKCFLYPMMSTSGAMSGSTVFDALVSYFQNRFSAASSGNNIFILNYYDYVLRAIGTGNLNDVCNAGLFDTTQNCDCGSSTGPTAPTSNGWYLSAPYSKLVTSVGDWTTHNYHNIQVPHDAFGIVYYIEYTNVGKTVKRMSVGAGSPPAYDLDCWGDTSELLNSYGQGYLFAQGAQIVVNEVLAGQTFTRFTDATAYGTPSNPASPVVVAGDVVLHHMVHVDTVAGDTLKMYVRFIHNINSPSHG